MFRSSVSKSRTTIKPTPKVWGVYLTRSHSVVAKNNIHDLCFDGAFF
jgi:hypothetical protein